jgi:hypothetical protein
VRDRRRVDDGRGYLGQRDVQGRQLTPKRLAQAVQGGFRAE